MTGTPDAKQPASPIVGIDLGTTNSLVAFHDESGPRILAPSDDEAIMPSAVRYNADGSLTVGREARAEAVAHPTRTVSSVKRLLGRSIDDAKDDLPYLSYEVVAGDHATARVRLPEGRVVSPQEVSAEILRALKRRASDALGVDVQRAVVTVPAYFDDAQRQATRDAGRLAGLDIVRIVNEPTAAALAYGLGTGIGSGIDSGGEPRTVAIYDLGGGTFDVSILRITPTDTDRDDASQTDAAGTGFFQVLATAGDTRLGGDDIDQQLVKLFLAEIRDQLKISESVADFDAFPPETRRAMIAFAEAVKIRLSSDEAAPVRIELGDGQTYERTMTRDELEQMMHPWVDRTIDACRQAMHEAERASGETPEIDAVVMVGGSTRIPMVRRAAHDCFGVEPYTALDPDRVVALGAAVQAGIMSGSASGSLLLDVIPLSLGIETQGGAVAKLITANSTVPARATEMFSTSVDGQTSIQIAVYQGEREMAEDCRLLGEFHLSGLPPMPAGIPQLEVEFRADASGVLGVSAHERRSGKRAQLQVIPNHGLTRDEVEAIERDSLTHARDDMTRHRVVDLIVNSKLDLKWIGERLERFGDTLDTGYRDELSTKLSELRTLVERAQADWRSVDANAFANAKQSLDEASVRLQEVSITESLKQDHP
ncbi:MAG: Hsp70 family protein [Planctomycetota bacterium]